ncbi:MBL fold metallo-hydrolase [Stygiolobus caldivivus]|uniref:Hydrolase n=1 Tax=Stygiolobus caldivivus TaxID=2824673 RepID=A0A8D5ZIE5_9CREN|nr:MBL fold metallo-hydrolase [Stygiolobus caldivivus]BCU69541.1 hydrolase [Stygiolobus caldivivus]
MIRFLLHSAFFLDNLILIDPHDGGSIGLPRPEVKAPLVLITHNHYDHNAYEIIPHETVKVRFYGEFNYKNYTIQGLKSYHDKEKGKRRGETAIYKITSPDGRVYVHLGDLGHMLDEKTVEELKNPDYLMVPVGGVITISPSEALQVIKDLNPKIVFPMHYWVKGHYMPLEPIGPFLELANKEGIKTVPLPKNEVNEESVEKGTVIYYSNLA